MEIGSFFEINPATVKKGGEASTLHLYTVAHIRRQETPFPNVRALPLQTDQCQLDRFPAGSRITAMFLPILIHLRKVKCMSCRFPNFQENPYYLERTHAEEKKLIRMQMKSTVLDILKMVRQHQIRISQCVVFIKDMLGKPEFIIKNHRTTGGTGGA